MYCCPHLSPLIASPETLSIPGFADPVSSMSHLLAGLCFLGLSVPLIRRARGKSAHVLTVSIFAFAVVFMFSMSGVFHLLPRASSGRFVLLRLDHASIFFLIAASFTPTHAILFRGWLRWGVIGLVWTLAAIAIPIKTVYFEEISETLGLALYLSFGWVGLVSGLAVHHRYGFRFMAPLLWGALAYTFGAILDFTRWPNPIPGVLNAHDLFHLFVIAGVSCHWRFCYQFADGNLPKPAMDLEEAIDEIAHELRRA